MHAVYNVAGVGGFDLHIFKLDPLKWLFHVCICMDVIVYTKGHSLYMTLFLTQECIQERDREIKYLKTQLASLQVYTGTNGQQARLFYVCSFSNFISTDKWFLH